MKCDLKFLYLIYRNLTTVKTKEGSSLKMSHPLVVWVYVLVVKVTLTSAQQNQFYTVLAPDTVRPNSNYFVAISVEGTGGDLQVRHDDGQFGRYNERI